MCIKVSIVMPVYNEEKYLEDAVNSFASQTIADECELICVDDGSSDNSLEILKTFHNNADINLVVLEQQNLGSGPARNAGMNVAQGEYIGFLDADDLYPSVDVLETMYTTAIEKGVDAVGGSLELLEHGKRFRFESTSPFLTGQSFDYDCMMSFEDYQFEYGFYRFIFKKSVLSSERIEFPAYLRFQDPCFFVRALNAVDTFIALHKTTYIYRSNMTKARWNQKKTSDLLAGILDICTFATANRYRRLYTNAIWRLCVDFDLVFRKTIFDTQDTELFTEYCEVVRRVLECGDELEMDAREFLSQPCLFNDALKAYEEREQFHLERIALKQDLVASQSTAASLEEQLEQCKQRNTVLRDESNRLRTENLRVKSECDAQKKKAIEAEKRYKSIKSSRSFKAGRVLTWAPRQVKKVVSH